MEEEVFTISITVSQPAAKIDGTVEIVDDYGLSIVASQQGVELEGVAMSEISQTALIAFGQWYKGDPGRDGDDGRDGTDGFSPVVTVTPTEDGHEVTITDASGDHTFDVNDGVGIPQTLSLVENELTLSDGGGTVTLPDGLPSQTGNAGKFLTTDGTEASWADVPAGNLEVVFTVGENDAITCDKTILEIVTALDEGRLVTSKMAVWPGIILQLNATAYVNNDVAHNVIFESDTEISDGQTHVIGGLSEHNQESGTWSADAWTRNEIQIDYEWLDNKPTLGTAAALDVAEIGNASTTQVVKGDDTRLSDSRNAADVYPWAKAATKPSYTASEVGALPDTTSIPTKTSDLTNDSGFITSASIPTNVSDLNNDAGYISNETDPTVPSWAKASTKPSYTASEVGAIASSEKGANNGIAELDASGKVPSSQLPSYVDDVLEYASLSAFPATGDSGKIYIAQDTNKTYRWSGSSYAEISESLALGETSSTAYAGNKGKANADAIAAIKDGTSIDSFGDVETALGNKQNTINSSHKLNADYIEDGTTNKVINVKPDWNAASGSTAEILNKPTIPDAVSGTDDGTNWTSLTIGSVTKAIPSGGGSKTTKGSSFAP